MTFKSLFAATALVALSVPAFAQDKSGTNVNTTATGTPGSVATLALAQELYDFGVANKDALSVLTAIKLARSVDVKEVTDRKKETKGEETAGQEEGIEVPRDLASADALAVAKDLAGEDEVMIGLIEDVEAEGARGRVGGASSTLSRLPAGMTDTWEIPFYGDSYAEIAVVGDGDANLDVLVTDENGNSICYDVSWSDKIYCDFVPSWNGYFYVTVENNGAKRNSYYIMTN